MQENTETLDWTGCENELLYKKLYKISVDENKVGTSLIRLVPDAQSNSDFITRKSHYIDNTKTGSNNEKYINLSPISFNLGCPAVHLYLEIKKFSLEEAKYQVSMKTDHYTNIKLIKEKANPDLEGKIFIWRFGDSMLKMFFETSIPLYHVMNGSNIMYVSGIKHGVQNYDSTQILEQSALYRTGQEAEADLVENTYNLLDFKNQDSLKDYNELALQLNKVTMGMVSKHISQDDLDEAITNWRKKVFEDRPLHNA